MSGVWSDLRHALRLLRRSPGFTAVAVLTLALGIGGTTALFSAVNGVLLRPLPFADPERLVGMGGSNVSYLEMLDWEEGVPAFEAVGLHSNAPWPYDLLQDGAASRVEGSVVSPGFFEVLGARATIGRVFTRGDAGAGAPRVAVVSDAFWRRRLGGDPDAVGRTVELNGLEYAVLGVMPPGFDFPHPEAELWTSLPIEMPGVLEWRGMHGFRGFGRLRDGAFPATAQAQLDAVERRMAERHPEESAGLDWALRPLQDEVVGEARTPLLVLFAAVGLVLLVACSNVAGLLLARAGSRRRELAIRRAVGAGSVRLVRQLLVESVVLACLGGLVGLAVAAWGASALAALEPGDLPRSAGIGLDGRVLGFALALSLLTGVAFGVAPALGGARTEPAAGLAEDGRGTGGRRRTRLRSALVVAEVSLALVLLAGAGLLVRTLWNLGRVDPGFDVEHLLTFEITLPESRYAEIPAQTRFFAALVERIRALPGVQLAGAVGDLPIADDMYAPHNLAIEGRTFPVGQEPDIPHRPATPGYLETMGIPILRGRGILASDREGTPQVAVVNRAMARALWPGENPIGRRVRWANDDSPWYTIVGIAGDVRSNALAEGEEPALYTAHAQSVFAWRRVMSVAVKAAGSPAGLLRTIEGEVRVLDPAIPVANARTMEQVLGDSIRRVRIEGTLLAGFSTVALALAALGIYGVLAQLVSDRRREIGIRMAVGAARTDVVALVVRQGLGLAAAGVAFGVVGGLAATRVLRAVLYGVEPGDPATVAGIAALVIAAALVASWLPARRAAALDPAAALRS